MKIIKKIRNTTREAHQGKKKEEAKGSRHLNLLKEYKKKIETELTNFCNDILNLLDKTLIK